MPSDFARTNDTLQEEIGADYASGLELSREEAYALLSLCLLSPTRDAVDSDAALQKLARYCVGDSSLI